MPSPLRFRFGDNNGGIAFSRVWLPDNVSIADVDAFANAYRSVVLPLTDCVILDAKYELSYVFDDAIPPAANSDVFTRLIAIFRNGNEYASISIPSAVELPYDVDGPYRNIRLAFPTGSMPPVLSALQSIVVGTVSPLGDTFPATYLVGGLSRGVL